MHSPAPRSHAFAAYDAVTTAERRDRIRSMGEALADTRVTHVNSTASGGGVAEMLHSLVPLMNDVGVDTEWLVMDAPEAFFEVTKTLHNRLQGEDADLSEGALSTYREWTARNAETVDDAADVFVLHDPQTLGMLPTLTERFPDAAFVWRCHIDLTSAGRRDLDFLREYLDAVDRAVFTRAAYVGDLETDRTIIHPSIDPLTDKNRHLDPDEVEAIVGGLPLAPRDNAPLLAQVSRFDPWKDPLGVVETYRAVREAFPSARLVLAGGMADDDPEAAEVYRRVTDATADDPDIHLLENRSDEVINVVQRYADVVLQKSLREGFALTVSEALWKETPVVGANVGGIPLQIEDGANGFLVDPEDIRLVADRVDRLLTDPTLNAEFGRRGRETVRDRFLLPRHLLDYLDLVADLADIATG